MFIKLILALLLCFTTLHSSESINSQITECCRPNPIDGDTKSTKPKISLCCQNSQLGEMETCPENFNQRIVLPPIYSKSNSRVEILKDTNISSATHFNFIFNEHSVFYYDSPDLLFDGTTYLLENGTLIVPNPGTDSFHMLDYKDFCLLNILEKDKPRFVIHSFLFLSRSRAWLEKYAEKILEIFLWVDVSFLAVILLILAVLPELQKIHRIVFMIYILCLCLSTTVLAYMKSNFLRTGSNNHTNLSDYMESISIETGTDLCVTLASIQYFFSMAGGFWLMAMNFNILPASDWEISTMSPSKKKIYTGIGYVFFSLVACGFPLFLISEWYRKKLFPGIFSHFPKPKSGIKCWPRDPRIRDFDLFQDLQFYFYWHIFFIFFFIVLIILRKCETDRINSMNEANDIVIQNPNGSAQKNFGVAFHVKLSLVVAVNYAFELISIKYRYENPEYKTWIIPNFYFALQGPIIITLLFCNQKVRQSLTKRMCQSKIPINDEIPLDTLNVPNDIPLEILNRQNDTQEE